MAEADYGFNTTRFFPAISQKSIIHHFNEVNDTYVGFSMHPAQPYLFVVLFAFVRFTIRHEHFFLVIAKPGYNNPCHNTDLIFCENGVNPIWWTYVGMISNKPNDDRQNNPISKRAVSRV